MDMLACILLLLMLLSTSSMFVFNMVIVAYVMLNILELIMELLPNFPTDPREWQAILVRSN